MGQQPSAFYEQLNDYIYYTIQSYGMDYTVDNYSALRDQYYSAKESNCYDGGGKQ